MTEESGRMAPEAARAAIAALRPKIDAADAAALAALAERAALVEEVGRVKRAAGLAVLDAEREAAVLSRVEARTGRRAMRGLWRVVMAMARASEGGDEAAAPNAEQAASAWRIDFPDSRRAESDLKDLLAMLLALDQAPLELRRISSDAAILRLSCALPEALARDLAERGAKVAPAGEEARS